MNGVFLFSKRKLYELFALRIAQRRSSSPTEYEGIQSFEHCLQKFVRWAIEQRLKQIRHRTLAEQSDRDTFFCDEANFRRAKDKEPVV